MCREQRPEEAGNTKLQDTDEGQSRLQPAGEYSKGQYKRRRKCTATYRVICRKSTASCSNPEKAKYTKLEGTDEAQGRSQPSGEYSKGSTNLEGAAWIPTE